MSSTYSPREELAATWVATYPLNYEYDAAGRLWKMRTYRSEPGNDPSQWPAGDLMEWAYHAVTPLLKRRKDANGRGLSFSHNGAGQKTGYSAWNPSGWLTWGGWGYEPATGRVSGVSAAANWVGYGYAAGTRTVQTTTFGTAVTTRTPDALGRVKTMETNVGGVLPSPLFKHTYVYDAQGRREKATQGNSNWWNYTYNTRNEVSGGYKKWPNSSSVAGFQNAYYYDAIGNRTLTFPDSTQAVWGANSLNQITSKTYSTGAGYLPEITVTGEANSAATVKVNGTTAARNGSSFSSRVFGSAYGEGVWATINVEEKVGTDPATASSGKAWIDPALESFSYDLDGNLTQDGRWTYTWDGENRLIKMETRTSGVPTNLPKDKLVFRYDSQGRRTEKEFWRKNSSDVYQLQYQSYFTYEGWNLIAEEIASPSSANVPELRRSFHWGVDLSGSLIWLAGLGSGTSAAATAVQRSLDRINLENAATAGARLQSSSSVLLNYVRSGTFPDALKVFDSVFRSSPGSRVLQDQIGFKVVQLGDKTNVTLKGLERTRSVCAHTIEITPPQLANSGEKLSQIEIKLRFFPNGVPAGL